MEDVHELAARDRRVHLRLGVVRIILFDDAVHNCVVDVAVIPVRAAVLQADLAGAIELVQRRGQLDGLRNRQRRVRLELVRRHAVDQVVLPSGLDARIVPAVRRNVRERELAHVGTGVRVERELRRLTRCHRNDRSRRRDLRQLCKRSIQRAQCSVNVFLRGFFVTQNRICIGQRILEVCPAFRRVTDIRRNHQFVVAIAQSSLVDRRLRLARLRDLHGLGRTAYSAGEFLFALFGFGRGLGDSAFVPYVLGIAVFVRIVGHSAAFCGAFMPMMRFIMRPFRRPDMLMRRSFCEAEPIDVCNIGLAGGVFKVEIDVVHALGDLGQLITKFHIVFPVFSGRRASQCRDLLAVQAAKTDMNLAAAGISLLRRVEERYFFRTVPGEIDIGIFDPSAAFNAANVLAVVGNSAVCICFKLCKFLSFDLLVRITELRLRKLDVQVKRIVCAFEIFGRRIRIIQSRLRILDCLMEIVLMCSVICQSFINLLCFFDFSHQILVGLNIIGCLLELRFCIFQRIHRGIVVLRHFLRVGNGAPHGILNRGRHV